MCEAGRGVTENEKTALWAIRKCGHIDEYKGLCHKCLLKLLESVRPSPVVESEEMEVTIGAIT